MTSDGKELMLIIFATIGTICDPTGTHPRHNSPG